MKTKPDKVYGKLMSLKKQKKDFEKKQKKIKIEKDEHVENTKERNRRLIDKNGSSGSDTNKKSKQLPPPVTNHKLPESTSKLEKKHFSIHIEKKELVGEEKPTSKTFKSKFQSTGLIEQVPQPPHPKTKIQSKTCSNLTPLLLPKAEKRSLSQSFDSPNEKKPKITPSESKKQPRKISNCYMSIFINFL